MYFERKAYCCFNIDEFIRKSSSSGGIFYLLAEYVINNTGVVFGAKFDENYNVVHDESDTLDGIIPFLGSKYVQSNIGDTYIKVKQHLTANKLVLFSGTPCQINGLVSFLGNKPQNLLLVDFICHGVPSPLVWRKYIDYISQNSNIKNISFRDKEQGWLQYSLCIYYENDKKYTQTMNENVYLQGFIKNLYLRPSCYSCASKDIHRHSDITLGDYWGVQNEVPNMFDNKGTSAIIINTEQGYTLFDKIKNKINCVEVNVEQITNHNSSYYRASKKNKYRKSFFKKILYPDFDFETITPFIKITRGKIMIRKIKNRIKSLIRKNRNK